jgi:hypothetical protein
VRFVSTDRVADAELTQLRRTTRGAATEATIQLTRIQPVRGNGLSAGTGGLSPDDLVEARDARVLLGQPLPTSLGLLEHMADPRRPTRSYIMPRAVTQALLDSRQSCGLQSCGLGLRLLLRGDASPLEWLTS